MLSRKIQNTPPNLLPEKWHQEVTQGFLKTYFQKLDALNLAFYIYAMTYPNELILILGVVHREVPHLNSLSFQISIDLDFDSFQTENMILQKEKKVFHKLMDIMGSLLEELLDQLGDQNAKNDFVIQEFDFYDYIQDWTEENRYQQHFYLKVSRENVALSLEADQILREKA